MLTATKPAPRFSNRHADASPWGRIDARKPIAEGIEWVSTPRHGGFRLSRERWDAMPVALRAASFTSDEFFEEDCAYCAVLLAFPDAFSAEEVKDAARTYARWFANG
jgi:hypothetical protein